jgi:pimeloyl-ACP methyl ester carboxylesterase
MNYRATLFAAALALAAAWPAGAQQQAQSPLVGTWVGDLKVGAVVLRLVFNVSVSGGSLGATMDSPDQGARGIPVSRVAITGTDVVFEVKAAGGAYAGTLAADGSSIDGAWKQSGQNFAVTLTRQEGAFVLDRPQEPKAPFPYTSVDVIFQNAKANVQLSGTLTVPQGPGPFPAVVLVTGSGPQDRNEALLGHKPFLVIADFLTRNGIAVLRYDDRGVGMSKGVFATATTLDFADDAEAAFTFLAARPEVDKRRVGIAGHSEGGLIAPLIASRNPGVGFIVLLAGPGLPGDQLLLLQAEAIARASGADEKSIASSRDLNAELYAIARKESDPAVIAAQGRKALEDALAAQASLSESDKAEARKGIDKALADLSTPWFRTFLALDPAVYLRAVHIPVLALNGTRDLQVPADADLAAIDAALKSGGNTGGRIMKMQGLNHLFQHAGTGLPDEYGKITETFAPEALAAIRDFVLGVR